MPIVCTYSFGRLADILGSFLAFPGWAIVSNNFEIYGLQIFTHNMFL